MSPFRKSFPSEFYACGARRFRVAATSDAQRQLATSVLQTFPPRKNILPVKNYPAVKFMFAATAHTTGVHYASS